MFRFTAWLPIVACLLFSPARSDEPIRVVADEWPPFSGSALLGRGMSIDVITEVLTRAGYTVESEILPWARIMAEAKSDRFDIIGSLFSDPEIETFMTYGDPFYQTEVRFLRHVGTDHTISDFEDLNEYSIAVGDGFLYSPQFDNAAHLNKVVVPTALQAIKMVAFERTDLTLDSVEVLEYTLATEEASIAERVEFLPFVLATHGVHMAVRKSHPDSDVIASDFNRVLQEMRADGSLRSLLAQHRSN